MDGSRRNTGLVLLGLLALGLRVWLVLALSTEHHHRPLGYEHGQIAENFLAGKGFSIEFLGTEGSTSQQAPFYPLLLAAVYQCLGVNSPAAILAVQLLQCVAGTFLVLVVVHLGWSLLPDRPSIGWVAGLMATVHPSHVYMVTHLQVVLWAALLLTLLLAVVVSRRWQATWGGAVMAGAIAGTLLLVEPILCLALPIVAAAFFLGECRGRKEQGKSNPRPGPGDRWFYPRAMGRVAAMAGVAALVIAPWLVRNRIVHGEFVFIKSTFGYAFWQGNCPGSWGTDKIPKAAAEAARLEHDGTLRGIDESLREARHVTVYIDDLALKPTGYRDFIGLSEPQRSRLLGRRAWEFVRENPGTYARLCLKRLQYFLLFDETNPKAANRLYRLTTSAWLVLALVGLLTSCGRWRTLWPTYAIFLAVMVFHSLVIVSTRFRIPVEPMSLVWASAAITPLAVRLFSPRRIPVVRSSAPPLDPPGLGHPLTGPHYRVRSGRPIVRR